MLVWINMIKKLYPHLSTQDIKNALPDPIKTTHEFMWHTREECKWENEVIKKHLENDYSEVISYQ